MASAAALRSPFALAQRSYSTREPRPSRCRLLRSRAALALLVAFLLGHAPVGSSTHPGATPSHMSSQRRQDHRTPRPPLLTSLRSLLAPLWPKIPTRGDSPGAGVDSGSRHESHSAPGVGGLAAGETGSETGVSQFPLRMLAVGDWGRNGTYNQSLVAHQMGVSAGRIEAQLVLSTGDNFYDEGLADEGAQEFMESFTGIYTSPSLQVPWYAVLGNHDYYGNALSQLSPVLPLRDMRWHCSRSQRLSLPLCTGTQSREADSGSRASARSRPEGVGRRELGQGGGSLRPHEGAGGVGTRGETGGSGCSASLDVFFYDTTPLVRAYRTKKTRHLDWRGLNSLNWTQQEQEQLQELEGWLRSSQATWKIVVGHHPVFSYGHHGSQKEMVELVDPLLRKYGVHIYMNGHDHNLQHIKPADSPVHYITNGAGSKAWRKVVPGRDTPGLEFFWPGQGFTAIEASPVELKVSFYGVFGEKMHELLLNQKQMLHGRL